jgi:hypothetical protein
VIFRIDSGQSAGHVRIGDVAYDVVNKYPLYYNITKQKLDCPHAGIIFQAADDYDGTSRILVVGLPALRENSGKLGNAFWPDCGWKLGAIGQMKNVSDVRVADVILAWSKYRKDESKLGDKFWFTRNATWTEEEYLYKRTAATSTASTFAGTCVGFVEFCYEQAGLDIVADDDLVLSTLPTTVQMHAFYREEYPLQFDPDDVRLLSYPACVET